MNLYGHRIFFCSSAVTDEAKRKHYRQKISEYMDRAEKIKQHVKQEKEGESLFYLCCGKNWVISEISEHLEIGLNIQNIAASFHFLPKKKQSSSGALGFGIPSFHQTYKAQKKAFQ